MPHVLVGNEIHWANAHDTILMHGADITISIHTNLIKTISNIIYVFNKIRFRPPCGAYLCSQMVISLLSKFLKIYLF